MSYGWGTGLTNDLLDNVMIGDRWFGPMSLVVKPTRPTVGARQTLRQPGESDGTTRGRQAI